MFIVVTYDINTETKEGQIRLRKVSRICEDYGVRIQNSVFECVVDQMQFNEMKSKIETIVSLEDDSIRYYNMGKHGRDRITQIGKKKIVNVDEPLIY